MFIVSQTYRIKERFREEYLEAIAAIVRSGMDLGCVFFYVWENDDLKNEFTEVMGFDSWSHYARLSSIPPTRKVEEIAKKMEEWIEEGITTKYFQSIID